MARHDEHVMEEHYRHNAHIRRGSPGSSPVSYSKDAANMGSAHDGLAAAVPPVVTHASPQSQAAKRKAVSEVVQHITGDNLPHITDEVFRKALKDGVLLCKVASCIWSELQCQHLEASDVEHGPQGVLQQRNHNVTAFLAAVEKELPSLPADCRFGIADLEAEGSDERPQVANCLAYITMQCHGMPSVVDTDPVTPPTAPRSSSITSNRYNHLGPSQQAKDINSRQLSYMTPHADLMEPQQHGHAHASSFGVSTSSSPGMLQLRQSPVHHQSPLGALPSPLMEGQSNLSYGGQHMLQQIHAGHPVIQQGHLCSSMVAMRSSQYNSPINAATHKSVQAAAGVTKLMQQCTSMLKERMGFQMEPATTGSRYGGSPGPDSAMKALGPVLEGVLGHLTEEYEKRLLGKDHELSRTHDAKNKAEKELARIQEELNALKQEVEMAGAAVARAAAEASAAEVNILEQKLAAAAAALEQKDRELEAARNMLNSADRTKADEVLRSQMECHKLREELDGLQDLHERYKRVIEENRNLYNTVQDLRGNIRVFCRIRPPGATGDLSPCCVDVGLEGDLAVYDQQNGTKRVFKVDRVFDQHVNQAAVYEDTQPLIRSVLDGYNVCIFAYGQTGSGKTHTMSGTDTLHEAGRGINYRALNDLFAIRDARAEEVSYQFRVQMLEIYNENLRDLLVDARSYAPNKLDILATQVSGCNVPGATQVDVFYASDVANLMAKGASQRATSETKMNDRSSRSHQILTVIVDGVHHVTKARTHGCLHLIDLAGSERVGKSEASGDRLVEAQHINRSLSALGDVMAALASKDRHIPYRNSKLTQLLQDSLQGQAKVMMFMHISPEANMFGESVSTLKFATRVSEITLGQAKKNVVSGKVFEAHEEVLKQQRFMESKEQQVQQLQAALDHERQIREQQQQELQQLRQQLQEQADAPTSAAAAKHRSLMPQLPLQQMLAAQAAEAQAAAAVTSSRSRALTGGGADESGYGSPASVSRSMGRQRVDMTPARDQDDSLMSARSHALADGYDINGVEATPRPTPRRVSSSSSGIPMPPREHSSAQKHLDRLQSARHFGTYRSSSVSTSGLAPIGSMSHRQLGDSAGATNLKAEASKLTGNMTARGTHSGTSSTRSSGRNEPSVPLTARVSAVIKSRVSELPPSAAMSMRQSGIYTRTSSTSAAGSSIPVQRATGAATSRSGSRWK